MFAQERMMDIKKEKEAFEAWFESQYDAHFMQFALDLDFYVDKHTQTCWEAWQAKAQAVPEWISVKDRLPPSDPCNREYWVYETLNNKVQHDYWVCPNTGLNRDFEPFFNNWSCTVTHWMPMVKYPKPPVQAQEPAND